MKDLQKDKIVMWQHKNYLLLTLLTGFGIPISLGYLNGDIWGMLLLAGFLRLVLSHHFTFFINSLAHIWGKQTYSNKHTAKDNGFLALLTYGEGYHNFHHSFEYDYRNGIRWYHFDPSKWFIKSLSWFGLTWSLRVAPEQRIEQAKAEFKLTKAKEHLLKIPDINHESLVKLELKLEKEYELLLARINDFYSLRKRYLDIKKQKLLRNVEKTELFKQLQELKPQLDELKIKLEMQKRSFMQLSVQHA